MRGTSQVRLVILRARDRQTTIKIGSYWLLTSNLLARAASKKIMTASGYNVVKELENDSLTTE